MNEQPDVLTLLKRMQEQLTSLERKVDALLNQAPAKTFAKPFSKPFAKPFSKPFKSFRPGPHHVKGRNDHGLSRGGEFVQGHPKQHSFAGQKNKPFFQKRKDRG